MKRPFIQPGLSVTEIMMKLLDHLRDNKVVHSISYTRVGNRITCEFSLCPLAGKCPVPHDKQIACQQLCALALETLAQGGYLVNATPAIPTDQTAQVAFQLQLLHESGEGEVYEQ